MQSFAIVPAAGQSRRMGRPKLLLPWRGRLIIEHVLEAWLQSRVSCVIVVVRENDTALRELVEKYPVHAALAENPPHMKDSIVAGLATARRLWAPAPQDAWLLAPADMPQLSTAIIDALVAQHDPRSPHILIPQVGDKSGHPVLFPWSLADEVERLGEQEGVNVLRERHPQRAIAFDDLAAFGDLDTPEDYRRLDQC